jgi:general secretion pathway protein G
MSSAKGFTLVELLIVVVILGIIAAVVIPGFSNASTKARESMLADDLRVIRTQILVFKHQHRGIPPGYPDGEVTSTPTEAVFVTHMTQASNENFETAAPGTSGYNFGPYLSRMQPNPLNDKSSVDVIPDGGTVPAGDNSHGWTYHPATLTFQADTPGTDETGKAYADY